LLLGQGIALNACGLILGLAGAFVAARSLAALLFGVQPSDLRTFAGVAALLLATGVAASYFPARGANKVDPITALRYE
jgi:putative ABC transport system permease protein